MTQKVLVISLFHPELVRGGAQLVGYELFQELRTRPGIDCTLLVSTDDQFPSLYKAGARITGFDGRDNEYMFLPRGYDHWWHKVGEPLLIESFIEFLQTINPDVVHFHHFLNFGIDLVTVVRRTLPRARIIFTFHEFLAICAADGHMVRRTDRSLCTNATQVRCHQCLPDRSPEDFMVRKMWFERHLQHVDHFTCPSRFMIEHYVNWGIPREKISQVTNGQLNHAAGTPRPTYQGPRNRFGFFGQLHDVKGVHILLRAVELLRAERFTDFRVELNGANLRFATAAVRDEIDSFLAKEAQMPVGRRIVFDNGAYELSQVHSRMARIDWSVVPSIWWEIFGLVISEAWMFGKPILCSNVGGMAERVKHDVDGLHFEMGSPRALADAIKRACTEEGLWQRLHENLPAAPTRADMADGYLALYRARLPEPMLVPV